MKELWISKEPVTVWFDNKPICDILEQEKLPSSVKIELEDWQYESYLQVLEYFNSWQELFAKRVELEKLAELA